MVNELLDLMGHISHWGAMARQEEGGPKALKPLQGAEVEGHIAIRGRGDGHRPQAQHGVACEEHPLLPQKQAKGAHGVPWGVNGL
jgi:hypothetical protein